jgi:prophage antirepressor-like protein
MSFPQVFQYANRDIRTIVNDGEPFWVAADVCEVLGIKNPRSSIALLDEDEKGVHTVDTPSGTQEMTIVNESGLYTLILKSRKPEAKGFKRWITHEVLPEIRKTGKYGGAPLGIANDPVLAVLGAAMEIRTAQMALETRVAVLEHRQEQAASALLALPAPESEAPELTPRKRCVQAVEELSSLTGLRMEDCWRRVYRSYDLRYCTNLTRLAGEKKKIDYLDSIDRIEQLYSVIVAEIEKTRMAA